MPKHPFPSTAKTKRRVCKSGQRKRVTVGSARGVPREPGAQGFLDCSQVPHSADSVPGRPGLQGQPDITVGGLGGGVGGQRQNPARSGAGDRGQLRMALGACSLQCHRAKALWDLGVLLP